MKYTWGVSREVSDKMCSAENTVTRHRISAKAFLGYSPMDVRGNLMFSEQILTYLLNRHAPLGVGLLHSVSRIGI